MFNFRKIRFVPRIFVELFDFSGKIASNDTKMTPKMPKIHLPFACFRPISSIF